MSSDYLDSAFDGAESDPQGIALANVDAILLHQSIDLRQAIFAAAIPHFFNEFILAAMLGDSDRPQKKNLFTELCKLPFCETFELRDGFNFKKLYRTALRNRLYNEDRSRFEVLSGLAASCFNGGRVHEKAERLYHLLWANNPVASCEIAAFAAAEQSTFDNAQSLSTAFSECLEPSLLIPSRILAWSVWANTIVDSLYTLPDSRLQAAEAGYQYANASQDPLCIAALGELVGNISLELAKVDRAQSYYRDSMHQIESYCRSNRDWHFGKRWIGILANKLATTSSQRESVSTESFAPSTIPIEISEQVKSATTPSNRIFISAVTDEFEAANARFANLRTRLSGYLRRADCDVKTQEDFRQFSSGTLDKLDKYVSTCAAVLHLVGNVLGYVPDKREVEEFLAKNGGLLLKIPEFEKERGDIFALSYTQWEAIIAMCRGIPLYVYATSHEDPRQQKHLQRLRAMGRYAESFGSTEDLFGKLLGDLRSIIPSLPSPGQIEEAKTESKRLNDLFMSATNVELINREPIPRDEAKSIFEAIASTDSHGVLLVATAGSGKSCILAQVIRRLRDQAIPCLAIKLDSVPVCNSSKQLGHELGLTDSPVTTLANMAQGAASVLIIDQLDSISTVSGRKTNTWLAFEEVRSEIAAMPGMKMIVACRDFDLQQDHRLRPIGDSNSGFTKVAVDSLTDLQIRESLDAANLQDFVPTPQQLKILSLPFHLVLFLQGYPELPFHRIGDLYNRFWDRKRADLRGQYGGDSEWYEVIKALSQHMSDHQATYAPKDIVDEWARTAEHMVSIHVLVDTGRDYRFFHESFFDYAFARSFCRTGESLHQFLTRPREDQQLFRRAQVRQIMGYRRESRRDDYLRDLRELLASSQIRFHIKRMVASELHRIPDPNPDEWAIVEPYVLNTDLSPAVSNALRGHEAWFDLLLDVGVWSKWLSSGDAILVNAAIWFLSDSELHKSRSKAIAELLVPYANAGEDWDLRLKRIMSWGVAHYSLEMTQLYFSMIRRGCFDDGEKRQSGGDFWGNHYGAEKENPRFIIDLVRCWLEHAVSKYNDGKSWNFLDQSALNHSGSGCQLLAKAVKDEPAYYLEQVFPVFEKTVLDTAVANRDILLNRAWPYLHNVNDPHDMNDSIFMLIGQCLEQLSIKEPSRFREFTNPWKDHTHQTFVFLMLRGYEANPAEFANECVEFLCTHKPRLNVGYGSWSGEGHGESAVSRDAIAAVTPLCSDELLGRLEDAVIGYCDTYERETPGRRGFAELLVLRSIDSTRRSQRANVRINELECGFPNLPNERPPRNLPSMASFVGSPIADSKATLMTDDQWVGAMTKYDGSTDRFRGGHVELSRVLSDLTRRDRMRFAKLALKLPESVDPIYFSAILDGLGGYAANLAGDAKEADEKDLSSFPIELIEQVIHRAHFLPTRPCGSSISHLVERLADRELATATLDALAYYATEDPDPESDIWKDKYRNYYGGNPFDHGINTVRGRATLAIGRLLYASQNHWNHFRPTIEKVISDHVISVRVCAVEALIPVLNWDRDEAVQLFNTCCIGVEAIWGSPPFDHFVHYAIRTHYLELRGLLLAALGCSNEEAVKSAASQITLFDLGMDSLSEEAELVRNGNEWMRQAACRVYAQNIGHVEVGDKCADRIVRFFNDESDAVRDQIGAAFWKTDGERLLKLEKMVLKYIESRSFESDPEELLRVLDESRAELPNVIVRAAERIVTIIGEKGSNIQFREASTAHSIATLVVRQYAQTADPTLKQNCLDLIDQMERSNYMGINDELEKIDR